MTAISQERLAVNDRPISKALCSFINSGICFSVLAGEINFSLPQPFKYSECFGLARELAIPQLGANGLDSNMKNQLSFHFQYLYKLLFITGRMDGNVKAVLGHLIHMNNKSG